MADILTRATNKSLAVRGNLVPSTENEGTTGIYRNNANFQSRNMLRQNGRNLVNNGQNMSHMFSLDANSMAISYW